MDEYLFITMAKLQADRQRLERAQRALEPAAEPLEQPNRNPQAPDVDPLVLARASMEGAVMRTTVTLAASLVINVLALALLSWSVSETHLAPAGEVTITQLDQ